MLRGEWDEEGVTGDLSFKKNSLNTNNRAQTCPKHKRGCSRAFPSKMMENKTWENTAVLPTCSWPCRLQVFLLKRKITLHSRDMRLWAVFPRKHDLSTGVFCPYLAPCPILSNPAKFTTILYGRATPELGPAKSPSLKCPSFHGCANRVDMQ